jgi:hypothetical protein
MEILLKSLPSDASKQELAFDDVKLNIFNKWTQQLSISDKKPLHMIKKQEQIQPKTENTNVTTSELNSTPETENTIGLLMVDTQYKKESPIYIICKETNTKMDDDSIKKIIIDFITKDDVSKLFIKRRVTESISAIVENKWNVSLCYVVSFILNKTVIYGKKTIEWSKTPFIPFSNTIQIQ